MSPHGGLSKDHPSTALLTLPDTAIGRPCPIAKQNVVRDCRQHDQTAMTPSSLLTIDRYVSDEQESESQGRGGTTRGN
jgi:hypothetical protein